MSDLGYHIRSSLEDGRVIAVTAAAQRAVARAVRAPGRDYGLLAMRAADNHLHFTAACSRYQAGRFANRVENSLYRRLGLSGGFASPHFEPVRDQRHHYNAFWYVLRQDERHDIDLDPWAEASNLPDLPGLRLLGSYTAANVARCLPRVRAEELAERLGVTLAQLREGVMHSRHLELLAEAAAAAAAVPGLTGNAPDTVEARRAAVALVGDSCAPKRLATLLGVTERSVRRLKGQPCNPVLVEAVARQLRLRISAGRPPVGSALTLAPAA